MPRRAFPFSFTTTCSRCLHPIGCFKPPESLAGPFISPTSLNSHSFRKSTRRNGFVKFSPPTSPSATLANPFPSAYSTPCSKFFTHNLSPARHRVAVTRVRIVYYFLYYFVAESCIFHEAEMCRTVKKSVYATYLN